MANYFPYEQRKLEIITKNDSQTNPKYGCEPEKRTTEELLKFGIVNIDKPSGPTSHQIAAYVKDIMKLSKAGHSGTLDPKVTGCLPVAINRATKATQLLLKAGKEYVGVMHIHKEVDEDKLRDAVNKFKGRIEQLPPVRSSVKRQKRQRSIYYFELLEIKEQDVLFRVGCQAGTYIRKLVHDLGESLGIGAHMSELRRTRVGPFNESSLCTLQDLSDSFYYFENENNDKFIRHVMQPVEKAVEHMPKIWVLDSAVDSLCHGASLSNPGIAKLENGIIKDDIVVVLTLKDELVCYGKAVINTEDMLHEKGLAVITDKVFLEPGV
ncbi:RNA-guided pseudouridylation complex pseudouridine synthase subunit Cbf5 [Candidatus Woesearchaeota archaeon]|nr:RNA-guided pseudouridylation complex pseudouridine synthase subunit Cbf5 [Candidatus Woesearchaeota archaeon]